MHPSPTPSPQAVPSRTPDGTRVYAVGDIHGRADLLQRLLGEIADDVRARPAGRVVMVFLGDYVDRGPQSREVVDRLLAGPGAALGPVEWVCLKGNHEEYMVRFLTEAAVGPAWCLNGGLATVRSYAGPPAEGGEGDMPGLQLALSRALPPAHLRFLSRLPLIHVEGDYVFVHAGLRPGVALQDQDPADLLWIRDDFLFEQAPFEKVVVHGHTPTAIPEIRPNRIGIDTGAYKSGCLTAVVLEGVDRSFIMVS